MSGVPHLQELHDKFNSKGFELVAVSSEDAGKIQSGLIDAKKVTYGVVRADISGTYETRGIPHSWVLDAEGKCIYKGHPSGVTAEKVAEWVANLAPTTVDKELHKDLKGAVKSFEKGEMGKSQAEISKAVEGTEDEAVKADAEYLQGLIKKHIDLYEAKMAKAEESGDLVTLGKTLTEASAAFKGSELGDKWAGELKELEKSDEYKDTVKAQDELDKIKDKLEDMRPSSARSKLEKIAEKYPNTPAGKEAAELAKRYPD
ncbi:MAG: hypothetical protein K8I27_09315 [Planctomycetes bacterium]|nr:hypothetical protein [Planctomycetota bacterium]